MSGTREPGWTSKALTITKSIDTKSSVVVTTSAEMQTDLRPKTYATHAQTKSTAMVTAQIQTVPFEIDLKESVGHQMDDLNTQLQGVEAGWTVAGEEIADQTEMMK